MTVSAVMNLAAQVFDELNKSETLFKNICKHAIKKENWYIEKDGLSSTSAEHPPVIIDDNDDDDDDDDDGILE